MVALPAPTTVTRPPDVTVATVGVLLENTNAPLLSLVGAVRLNDASPKILAGIVNTPIVGLVAIITNYLKYNYVYIQLYIYNLHNYYHYFVTVNSYKDVIVVKLSRTVRVSQNSVLSSVPPFTNVWDENPDATLLHKLFMADSGIDDDDIGVASTSMTIPPAPVVIYFA